MPLIVVSLRLSFILGDGIELNINLRMRRIIKKAVET